MNIPNRLTLARFGMTLVFVGLAAIPASASHALLCWRIGYVIAILGGMTDFLDGYLARKYNQVTNFGKLMDPLADKIFTVSAFVVLSEHGLLPGWVTIIVLTREFAVTGLRTMAAQSGQDIAAGWSGKVKTMAQMLVLLYGGLFWTCIIEPTTPGYFWLHLFWLVVLYGVAALTVYTGIEYFWKGRQLYAQDT